MVYVTEEGMWSENCLITIQPTGTANKYYFAGITSDVAITEGDKEFDQVVCLDGSRLVKKTPQGQIEITMTMYPIDVKNPTTATEVDGVTKFFDTTDTEWTTYDGGNSSVSQITRNRETYRVAILWTEDTSVTDAMGSTKGGATSLRYVVCNAYMTQHNLDFTGDGLKATVKFKANPFDITGYANRQIHSNAGAGTGMSALNSQWTSGTTTTYFW